MQSTIKDIINEAIVSEHGEYAASTYSRTIEKVAEALADRLAHGLQRLGNDAHDAGVSDENFQTACVYAGLAEPEPEPEPEVDLEVASDEDRVTALERQVSGLVDAVAGLTALAERHLGRV